MPHRVQPFNPMSVTLYHWEPNANSGKPMLTLAEKGVAYESRYLDLLKFDQHQPGYLAVNPDGTIPAMVHGSRVLTESTPMMEYIDDAFPGPPLKPRDPKARWRMRWWMRFFDAYFAPSLSMIGWQVFVGPAARQRPPEELRAAIDRIPLESRRIAWRKAVFNEFSPEELAESRRRVLFSTLELEKHLQPLPLDRRRHVLARRYQRLQSRLRAAVVAAGSLQRREDPAYHGVAAENLRTSRRARDLGQGAHPNVGTHQGPGAPCLNCTRPSRTHFSSSR